MEIFVFMSELKPKLTQVLLPALREQFKDVPGLAGLTVQFSSSKSSLLDLVWVDTPPKPKLEREMVLFVRGFVAGWEAHNG